MSTQTERAERFRALHDRSKLLLLPNAWDAGSARVFEDLGFDAIATTSAGVAWSLGYADGECAPLAEVAAAVRRIVRVYPMALADAGVIRRLCSALDAPVNVGAHASLPGVAELARLGVARISTATRLAALALSCAREAALRLRDDGRFDHLDAAFAYPDLQRLFARF